MDISETADTERASWRQRVSRLFTQPIKLPGWVALLLFVYTDVPDTYSRTEFWIGVTKSTGGYVAMAASIVGSEYFGPSLLIFGLLWILFVGEPTRGVQRHHWLRYVGWSVISVCLAAVVITATYGWFELKLRETYAAGAAGAPRNTPDANNPARPQIPAYVDNWGGLQPDQVRILIQELPKLKALVPVVYFSTVVNDAVGFIYWTQFENVFQRSGLTVGRIYENPRGPEEEGLMLAVRDPNNISLATQKIREAFEIANIPMKIITAPENILPNAAVDSVIFIGPRPLRWR